MIKFVDLHLLNTNRSVIVRINDIKEVLKEGIKTVVKLQDETSYDCHQYDFKRLRSILMEEEE
jgi:predicted AAA+ superfamily ATPase